MTDAAVGGSGGDVVCRVCAAAPSKYACPKCGTRYCGLDCYRTHGGGSCGEAFARDEAAADLARTRAPPADRAAVAAILKRHAAALAEDGHAGAGLELVGAAGLGSDDEEEEGDDDDENAPILDLGGGAALSAGTLARLARLAAGDGGTSSSSTPLTGAAIEAAMTPGERAAFARAVASGGLAVPAWVPWWDGGTPLPALGADGTAAVQALDEDKMEHVGDEASTLASALASRPPRPPSEPLRRLADLLPARAAGRPAPEVAGAAAAALFAYAAAVRAYNGDWEADPAGAAAVALAASPELARSVGGGGGATSASPPPLPRPALAACVAAAASSPVLAGSAPTPAARRAAALGLARDVAALARRTDGGGVRVVGPILALCDLGRLFRRAAAAAEAEEGVGVEPPIITGPAAILGGRLAQVRAERAAAGRREEEEAGARLRRPLPPAAAAQARPRPRPPAAPRLTPVIARLRFLLSWANEATVWAAVAADADAVCGVGVVDAPQPAVAAASKKPIIEELS